MFRLKLMGSRSAWTGCTNDILISLGLGIGDVVYHAYLTDTGALLRHYRSHEYSDNSYNYNDVIMSTMASQITSLKMVYWTVYWSRRSKKTSRSASLDIVRGIHRWPVNSPHKGPVTRKTFPFDDVIMHNIKCVANRELGTERVRETMHPINRLMKNDGLANLIRIPLKVEVFSHLK